MPWQVRTITVAFEEGWEFQLKPFPIFPSKNYNLSGSVRSSRQTSGHGFFLTTPRHSTAAKVAKVKSRNAIKASYLIVQFGFKLSSVSIAFHFGLVLILFNSLRDAVLRIANTCEPRALGFDLISTFPRLFRFLGWLHVGSLDFCSFLCSLP